HQLHAGVSDSAAVHCAVRRGFPASQVAARYQAAILNAYVSATRSDCFVRLDLYSGVERMEVRGHGVCIDDRRHDRVSLASASQPGMAVSKGVADSQTHVETSLDVSCAISVASRRLPP